MRCFICQKTDGRIVNSKKHGMILCAKHYKQMQNYGKITDSSDHNTHDRNEIIENKSVSTMVIRNRLGEVIAETLVDTRYVDIISVYKWNLSDNYVSSGAGSSKIYLHRLITNCPADMYVDHIDRDPLNNRLSNLRIVTNQQNMLNVGMYKHNTSGVKGVTWDKERDKWVAQMCLNDKHVFLGRFENKQDAVIARKQGELEYFKPIMDEIE